MNSKNLKKSTGGSNGQSQPVRNLFNIKFTIIGKLRKCWSS